MASDAIDMEIISNQGPRSTHSSNFLFYQPLIALREAPHRLRARFSHSPIPGIRSLSEEFLITDSISGGQSIDLS